MIESYGSFIGIIQRLFFLEISRIEFGCQDIDKIKSNISSVFYRCKTNGAIDGQWRESRFYRAKRINLYLCRDSLKSGRRSQLLCRSIRARREREGET